MTEKKPGFFRKLASKVFGELDKDTEAMYAAVAEGVKTAKTPEDLYKLRDSVKLFMDHRSYLSRDSHSSYATMEGLLEDINEHIALLKDQKNK